MRWEGQRVGAEESSALPGLESIPGLQRTVRTPEFAGITFHEIHAKSALTRQHESARIPVRWTLNPYRGCSHACTYCFARRTHTYLELDAGADFDREIVVKTNVAAVLRRELARPSWAREHVAMGTSTDPYQRAEGRYRLMPEIIEALVESGTPFSILTKGTMLMRDLPLLAAATEQVTVGVSISLALLDADLQDTLEPGTPSPAARLRLIRAVRDAGLPVAVLIAPVMPRLNDSMAQLRELVRTLAEAGATTITGMPLRLGPGTKEWFMAWLGRERPDLVETYRWLYRSGQHLDDDHARLLTARIERALVDVPMEPAPPVANPWLRPRAPTAPTTALAPATPSDEPRLF